MVTVEGFVCTTGDNEEDTNSLSSANRFRTNPTSPKPSKRRGYKAWEDWTIYLLKQEGYTNREIGDILGRTKPSIHSRVTQQGLANHPPTGEPGRYVTRILRQAGVQV